MMKWKWFSTSNLNEINDVQSYDNHNHITNNNYVVYRGQGSPGSKEDRKSAQFPLVQFLALPPAHAPHPSAYDDLDARGRHYAYLGPQEEIPGGLSSVVSGARGQALQAGSLSSADDNDSPAESMSISSASSAATDSTYSEGQRRRLYVKRGESPATRRAKADSPRPFRSQQAEGGTGSAAPYGGQGQVTVIPGEDESRALARDRGVGQPPRQTTQLAVDAGTRGKRGWVSATGEAAGHPSVAQHAARGISQSQVGTADAPHQSFPTTASGSRYSTLWVATDPGDSITSEPVLMRHSVTSTWAHRGQPPPAGGQGPGGRPYSVATAVPNGTFYIEPAQPYRSGKQYHDPRGRTETVSHHREQQQQQQSSLLRSRSFSTSLPSLLTLAGGKANSKEDKKREKEEKKREKEEKQRQKEEEKRREKEEKRRKKEEKKLRAHQTLPRNFNVVPRPVEQVYATPRLYAVPIEFDDTPRSSAAPAGQSNFILQARPHSSAPDFQRLEPPSSESPPPLRAYAPRTVVLHKSPEGYGFVLRGAKSHTHVGNLNFQPSPEFPALQYLDSVDHGSQAQRAGLLAGDFILEINGENVVQASHERVVQLIRASGNDLTLKVVTVRPAMEQYTSSADWFRHQDGSMTLPPRKKQAPLPPRRDPQTSLSYSKATSKSMSEGLAEIEKLDQTIAEFDQQSTARRHSVHGVDSVMSSAADQKVASVKATHAIKRMSVVDPKAEDSSASPSVPLKSAASDPRSGAVSKMSPSELRIKKYHKKNGSNIIERSKSTPDLADIELGVVQEKAYGMGEGPGNVRPSQDRMSATWSKSHSVYVPVIPGMTGFEKANLLKAEGDKASGGAASPELPTRAPVPKRKAPQPPPKGEMVLINTSSSGAQSIMYANIAEEIAARQKSPYESSFRPGTNAQLTDNPSVMTQSLEQAKLQHRKSASFGNIDPSIFSSSGSTQNNKAGVSFAEDRVYETAQTFIKKHPNARLLVTADVHGGAFARDATEKVFYEPEPDYDDSDEDKTGSSSYASGHSMVSVSTRTSGATSTPASSANSLASTAASQSSSMPITVIAVGKDAVRQMVPTEKQYTVKSDIPAAPKNDDRSGAVSQIDATVVGIASSSRPSPVLGRDHSVPTSRDAHQNEAGSSVVYVHHQSDETVHHFSQSVQPPPLPSHPPPSLLSHSPPPLPLSQPPPLLSSRHPDAPPPPPPPPPPPVGNPPLVLPGNVSPEKRAQQTKSSDSSSLPPHPVPTSDIMAAVALRKSRLETEGPRLIDRPPSVVANPTRSATDRYQEALKAAVAKRKTILESSSNSNVVEDIEAKLQKNRKLQSAKHFGNSDTLRKEKKTDAGDGPADDTSSKVSEANASKSGVSEDKLEIKSHVTEVTNLKSKAATESSIRPKEIMHRAGAGNQSASTVPVSTVLSAKDATVTPTAKRSPEIGVKKQALTTSAAQNEAVVSNVKGSVPEVSPVTKPGTPPSTKPGTPPATKSMTPSAAKSGNLPATVSTTKITTAPATSKVSNTTPVSKTGTINSSGFLALAEKARQEYLQKVSASKADTKQSPTEGSGSSNMPKLISASSAGGKAHQAVAVDSQPIKGGDQLATISIKDKIANFQDGSKVKVVEVVGVTDDHSHTEASLSNGTIKRRVANGKSHEDQNVVAPPSAFGDSDKRLVTQLEIIPPPPSFGLENIDSFAGDQSASAFGDDAASFVSSVSSLSTLSSEHGDGKSYHQYDDAVTPPPPPGFGDETMASTGPAGEDVPGTFVPPPVQFSGVQGQGYQSKGVEQWSCDDVLAWLDSVEMGQYKPIFAQNKVDGNRLQALERNDYSDLGVTQVGHRMALQRAIKRLLLQNNPSS